MEPKKNPKYDVHRYRAIIFNASLLISLSLVIMAFKWTVADDIAGCKIPLPKVELADDPIIIPVTRFEKSPEPPKPREIKNDKPISSTEFTAIIDDVLKETIDPSIDQNDPIALTAIEFKVEIEKEPELYDWSKVEKMPQPLGGYSTFYDLLQKKLKYPSRAVRNQTKGKVYVVFTVDATGQLSDFVIQKGIGDGCDEEAIRVIKMSKWEPGKQRGRPVKVRMIQPITFSLQ